MPFTRNARGRRVQIAPAAIAALISKAYQEALGPERVARARPEILAHAQAVLAGMGKRHGDGIDHEWSQAALQRVIIEQLSDAPVGVLEAFLRDQGLEVTRKRTAQQWGEFAARLSEPDLDPVWDLRKVRAKAAAVAAQQTSLETLGGGTFPARAVKPPTPREPWRRSHWLQWLEKLARAHPQPIDLASLKAHVLSLPAEENRRSPEGWLGYWNETLYQLLPRDPQLVRMIELLQLRQWRAELSNQPWCAGMPGTEPLLVEFSAAGDAHYRKMAIAHLHEIFPHLPLEERQWAALGRLLEPQRDFALRWQAMTWMRQQQALWQTRLEQCPGAHELPQWAYMRLALALAAEEVEPFERASEFYLALARHEVAPSETMLRNAGALSPRWLEDQAIRVQDEFEDIHGAIYRAAVDTKWTGTVALDWSGVRSAGREVGRRRSAKGALGFVRAIDAALDAQGREIGDHPVTVSLAVWHPEVENWLKLHDVAPHMQAVLLVSDAFLHALSSGEQWTLLDPAVYPECLQGSTGYLEALSKVEERRHEYPRAHRVVSSARLWGKILSAVSSGGMFLTFADADAAFTPFPERARPIAGLEGVGALPLPPDARRDQRIAWPSLAVNLRATLDERGLPVPKEMLRIVICALRMADNMIDQSVDAPAATLEYRPVCLGAVGFFEAVQSANYQTRGQPEEVAAWISRLCQAWATTLLRADRALTEERGPSPWASYGRSLTPQQSLQRLRLARRGSLGMRLEAEREGEEAFTRLTEQAQRFAVRTVWAPFEGAARMVGVTPGGMGTLRALDRIDTPSGEKWVASPLWHALYEADPDETWKEVLDPQTPPEAWPLALRELVMPDAAGWEVRMRHAALVRAWVDQGVSLTLPRQIPEEALAVLVQRAWWFGLSNLRFAAMPLPSSRPEPIMVPAGSSVDKAAGSGMVGNNS